MTGPDGSPAAPPLGVALAGFMGVGKSTVGRAVAEAAGLPFVDLDARIVSRAGGRSIPDIFRDEGEAGFRRRESEALRSVCAGPPVVLALGGGTVHQAGAVATLSAGFVTVVLAVPWGTIEARIRGDAGRPLASEAERLFRERAAGYAAAGPSVDGVGTPAEVAARVLGVWRRTCASM